MQNHSLASIQLPHIITSASVIPAEAAIESSHALPFLQNEYTPKFLLRHRSSLIRCPNFF